MRLNMKKAVTSLVAVGTVFLAACSTEERVAGIANIEPTTTVVPEDGLTEEEIEALVDEAFGRMGFDPSEVDAGEEDVEFDGAAEERGDASFSDVTLKTREDVAEFLGGDSPESIAARERVQTALADMPGELERALSGEGYVPIQFNIAVQYFGTTYFNGSEVIDMRGARQTGEDDILWLFISREGVIVAEASIRADCGNPNFDRIVPVRPETPPAPPIEQPPCPPGTVPDEENPGSCRHISIGEPDPCASHPELNIDVCQPPQDNDTSGIDTGPTPGAPTEPYVPPPGPEPEDGTPAPPPSDGGYDSGSPDGSGTPDGSACDLEVGCEGGGSTPPTNDPEDTGQGGSNPGTVPPPP